jgi:tetratricopeptide (TPR) repeat protein
MSQIKDENLVTTRWLNNNGISYLTQKLIKCKIIEDKGKDVYHILNKEVLFNIIKKEFDKLDINDDVSKLQFSAYASKFFCNGREIRRIAYIEDDNLNKEKAFELYNKAAIEFSKYISLRDKVLHDPTFNGHFELGKTYLKLNNAQFAKKELSIASHIAAGKQSFRNLGRAKFQLANIYFDEENYYKAALLYEDLLNDKDTYKININEYKDILFKIMICKSTLSNTKEDDQINIQIRKGKTNSTIKDIKLNLEKNAQYVHELITIAEYLYKSKELFLADYIFNQAKRIAKICKDKNCNVEISELQKQSKIYRILR